MSNNLIIYGASDDRVEIEGLVCDEFDHYDEAALVTVKIDDAVHTRVRIEYDPDGSGEWRIQPTTAGGLVAVTPARGEAADTDEDGCPGYSDKAVVDMRGVEARRVTVTSEAVA